MAVTHVKIFGERNCGTNYLQGLVARNFNLGILPGKVNPNFRRLKELEWVRFLYFKFTFHKYLGWKHAQLNSERLVKNPRAKDTLFLILTKNPYSFLLSLYKKPYHYKLKKSSFESFLQAPWKTVGFELGPPAYANPVDLWNSKGRSYLGFKKSGLRVEIVKYEDLIADPEAVFDFLAETHGLQRKPGYFSNITKSMKGDAEKDFSFYKDYYLQQKWRNKLSEAEVKCINMLLDNDVLSGLGYNSL